MGGELGGGWLREGEQVFAQNLSGKKVWGSVARKVTIDCATAQDCAKMEKGRMGAWSTATSSALPPEYFCAVRSARGVVERSLSFNALQ